MEAVAEVPQTGTKLKLDTDRVFEGQPGDSTLRLSGESPQGGKVIDATYVEVAPEEAQMIGFFLRATQAPPTELHDKIAQELVATFGSCLTGRDAHQAAELSWNGIVDAIREKVGWAQGRQSTHRIEALAERFERAAGRARTPYGAMEASGN